MTTRDMDRTSKDTERRAGASTLQLLRRVRDIMASGASVQERLDHLVAAIAEDFHCEVCSLYLMRAGDILELFASRGLKQGAVHLTRLNVGEGLVGEIAATAQPLNILDAQSHPHFVYRPETGEDLFHSLAGVPILHSHRVLGVLVVQRREASGFSEEQVEVLQTIAMVLAEVSLSGRLVNLKELKAGSASALEPQHFIGLRLSPGLAKAPAVFHRPHIEIKNVVAADVRQELERFENGIINLQASIESLIRNADLGGGAEQHDIMETYRMLSQDRGWQKQIQEAIEGGLTAEAAVRKVQEQLHARMQMVSSEYLRERMLDLDDLSQRLLMILAGGAEGFSHRKLPEKFVLVARSLGPAELLEYTQRHLQGIVLEEGSFSSHIAILARAMEIPVVGKVVGALALIAEGEPVIVDGDHGEVFVRPSDEVLHTINDHIKLRKAQTEAYAATRHLPAETRDGKRMSLHINVGLTLDLAHLKAPDVEGIGLYRTELPYLMASNFPDVAAQTRIYGKVMEEAGEKRVIFRSFDIGGDKQVPYLHTEKEENPAMGWRATRIGLDRPAILVHQFRAMLQAAAGKTLEVMFPFIAEVPEFVATHALLEREIARAQAEGHNVPSKVRVGTMIEIPSLLFQLPDLLPRLDFVSVGSNDLLQFLFACDRGTGKLADRYDALSPIVLRLLRQIVQECDKAGVEMGFCGEMAGKPLEAMALLGLGIRSLSMAPSSIGPVKAMVRSVDSNKLAAYMDILCDLHDHSVRGHLVQFAKDHEVIIAG